MPFFPTTQNGSVCQFPFQKQLQYRTIVNNVEDGSRVVLEDPNASTVTWKLTYSGLTDDELGTLQAFFASMCGRLKQFTFLDPAGNLLNWSEDFTQVCWQKSSLLHFQAGANDPLGTQRATTVANTGPGDLAFSQTLAVPGSYLYCFSLFALSATPVQLTLSRDTVSRTFAVTNTWQQLSLTDSTSGGTDSSTFKLTLAAGQAVTIFGLMVSPQAQPATYIQSLSQSGVYPATRFDSDVFAFTSEAPNSNKCELTLYSRLPL